MFSPPPLERMLVAGVFPYREPLVDGDLQGHAADACSLRSKRRETAAVLGGISDDMLVAPGVYLVVVLGDVEANLARQ